MLRECAGAPGPRPPPAKFAGRPLRRLLPHPFRLVELGPGEIGADVEKIDVPAPELGPETLSEAQIKCLGGAVRRVVGNGEKTADGGHSLWQSARGACAAG